MTTKPKNYTSAYFTLYFPESHVNPLIDSQLS